MCPQKPPKPSPTLAQKALLPSLSSTGTALDGSGRVKSLQGAYL